MYDWVRKFPFQASRAFADYHRSLRSFLGGALAKPHDRFPETFTDPFWEKYPYFLPCASVAGFSAFAFLITFFFLNEVSPFILTFCCAIYTLLV
jgi:hypothetical protein